MHSLINWFEKLNWSISGGNEEEYRFEKKLVRWVQDITHNMGGLRSAADLQFSLIRETIARESGSAGDHQGASDHADYCYIPLSDRGPSLTGRFLEPIVSDPRRNCLRVGASMRSRQE